MNPQLFAFFAGAGFLDLGFQQSGYSIVFVNEYQEAFLDAYKHSRRVLGIADPVFGHSGRSIVDFLEDESEHRRLSGMVRTSKETGELVGFIGGPPCPDFSVGGKNRGRHGENGKLSAVYVDLICDQRPDFFLFENVKGLWRTKRHRAFFDELKNRLRFAGYHTAEKLINCINFGAPQDRERIILVGIQSNGRCSEAASALLNGEFPWMRYQAHLPAQIRRTPWPSTSEFIEDGPMPIPDGVPRELTVEHWFQKNRVDRHPNASHCFKPRAGLTRFKTIAEGDDSKKSFKRLHRWRYSPTACYGNNEVHLHPYKARRITVAEALAIQSLPPEYELPPDMSLSGMFKTVGNGVPYLAAKALAQSMLDFLRENYEDYGFRAIANDSAATARPGLQLRPA